MHTVHLSPVNAALQDVMALIVDVCERRSATLRYRDVVEGVAKEFGDEAKARRVFPRHLTGLTEVCLVVCQG
jgi:hypothetical protein